MTYQAICNKCKRPVITGFSKEKTEEIASRPMTCAFCNDDKKMYVTIEEIKNDKPS